MWVAEGRGRQGGEGKQISNNDMPCVGEEYPMTYSAPNPGPESSQS